MSPTKTFRPKGGSRVSQSLSVKLSDLFEEAKRLTDLKSAWGRLPESVKRQECLTAIEQWFDTGIHDASAVTSEDTDDYVRLEWLSLREIWTVYPNLRAFLRKGLDSKTILRLEGLVADVDDDEPF